MMPINSDSIKILFLGTGAADWPAPNYPATIDTPSGTSRGFASVLIDAHILIDCGATVPDALHHFGADVNAITDILLTHTHADHWNINALQQLLAQRTSTNPINLRAHPSALSLLPQILGVNECPVVVGQTVSLPKMKITVLEANHDVGPETALHFLLEKPAASVLYATDGAWFLKNTWEQLRSRVLDAVIWDAACGETRGDWRIFEHNNVDMIKIMRQTLVKQGVLASDARIFLTHMSRGLCAPHDAMTQKLAPQGLTPAYDGLEITVFRNAKTRPNH
jgi:phosphoribosyl 1,2-cyclic phosphate phosphodiesterase